MTKKELKKQLYLKDLLQEPAIFQCVDFGDGIINYQIKRDDGMIHEILLIADDSFFPYEKLVDLIDRKRLNYFQYNVFMRYEDGNHEVLESYEYAPLREKKDRE